MILLLTLILSQESAHAATTQTPRELEQRLILIEAEIRTNALKEKADRDQAVVMITGKIDAFNPTLERIAEQLEKVNENLASGSHGGLEFAEKILDMAVNSILMLGGGLFVAKNAGAVKGFLNGRKGRE